MKDCKKIHPLLSLDLEGALSKKEKALVEKHLAVCITARRVHDQFGRMREALRNEPSPRPPADLHARIMARLGRPVEKEPLRIAWGRSPLFLAAALVLVFLFVNRYPEWRTRSVPVPKEQVPEQAGDLSQKEEAPALPQAFQANKVVPSSSKARSSAKADKKALAETRPAAEPMEAPAPSAFQAQGSAGASAPSASLGKDSSAAGSEAPSAEAALPPARADDEQGTLDLRQAPRAKSALAPAAPAASNEPQGILAGDSLSRDEQVDSWRGDHGPQEVREEILTDAAAFEALWKSLQPGQALPRVDFTRQAVVFLAAGTEPSAGYRVGILRMENGTDGLTVHYRVEAPQGWSASVLTGPWLLRIIARPPGAVRFVREEGP